MDRRQILEENEPSNIIDVDEVDQDGNKIPNSYMGYVYRNCLGETQTPKNGYLFICEPLSGDRSTRMIYLTQEEFENYAVDETGDKYASICKKYLDMSQGEFEEEKGTEIMKHTTLEAYKARLEFYLHGKKSELINTRPYTDRIQKLYGDSKVNVPIRKYTRKQIAKIGENETGKVDRTAQEETGKEGQNKGEE